MSARSQTFALAPAAVARIASVPIEALEVLSTPELARRAATAGAGGDPSFVAEYERVIAEHRHALWRHTAGDARVRCGLALSSPALLADLSQSAPSPRRNKRARHLDTSLYRYLARAVGRIEPCGLWTSVTLASLEETAETTVQPCAPRCHVAPELGPFRALLRSLSACEPYRERGPYRLDPTLQRDDGGRWIHGRRPPNGGLKWTVLPASEAWSLMASRWGDGRPRSLPMLAEALGPEVRGPVRHALLGIALEAGLLVGGLDLPARFGTPWEALEGVVARLDPEHRGAWSAAYEELRCGCKAVDRALEAALAPGAGSHAGTDAATVVLEGQRRAREVVERLAVALGVPCPSLPTALLRCDETAPFRIGLGRHDRRRVERLLRRWAALEHRNHTHRRWARRAARAAALAQGRVTAAPQPTLDDVMPGSTDGGGPPLGALVLRPGVEGLATPWVRGLSHAPTVTHARHAYHLASRGDALLPWFRAAYRDLERQHGVESVDLVCSTDGSPNVQARPRYVDGILDPWGTASDGPRVEQLRLVPGPSSSAVVAAYGQRRLAAHVFTAVAIPSSDAITHRLMTTSFDDRLEPTEAEPAALEPETDDLAPRRARRVQLSDAETEQLLAVRGAARFVRWQALVQTHGWSRWVRIHCGARPGLLVPTDGPLAIEAAFEGAGSKTIVIEDVLDAAWLPGPHGHHFVELVLPVRRTPCAWTIPSTHEERTHGRV
ncbi:lantibiotic dehydratase [Paraliomyxa miuraensis]|uniref:lantibiotic dehydratase n=1 Tax=Paraliomyxa miuraensis TaxID=376150 RepID=UPI00225BA4A6|nr:lantibiotic dehydratase [Paraliomyxa miuraensis]MCX4247477.1 lantibiotic dehydratase [Paraliomyxa miuraensis]